METQSGNPEITRARELFRTGELRARVTRGLEMLQNCTACPRYCHIDRTQDRTASCRTGRFARISSAFPHFGEEDCLRGTCGSGTIFFTWCNLRCVFCQNFEISQQGEGREIRPEELAETMLWLQNCGCHNVNFVTPEHVVPQVLEVVEVAVARGLRLPLVYNTGGYDDLDALALLDGVIDIYMPDFKLWNPESALTYLRAKDYPERAREAIREMHRQVGDLVIGPDGLARRGLLLRHLLMPGLQDETKRILNWIREHLGPKTYINLMGQYHSAGRVSREHYPEINRRVTRDEFDEAARFAREIGLERLDERSLYERT